MTAATLRLPPGDARLVALAAAYHLGRPGAETGAAAAGRGGPGLAPLLALAEEQAGRAEAAIEVTPWQLSRLGAALHGTANELKQHGLGGGRSAAPGFDAALARLFPGLADEDGGALDLASRAVLLRRRLDAAVREADARLAAERRDAEGAQAAPRPDSGSGGRPRWRFWRR